MKTLLALLLASLFASSAMAQQYRNFESTPDGRGGIQGTWGKRNFEIDNNRGSHPSGRIGGRRAGSLSEKPSIKQGSTGATQRRCYVDGDGRSACR